MKIIIDNQIIKTLAQDSIELMKNPLILDPNNQISLRWPTLLEYLGLGAITNNLTPFDEKAPLFQATLSTLHLDDEEETIFYIYDRLFVENLKGIKDLQELQLSSLLQSLKDCGKHVNEEVKKVFSPTLTSFQQLFNDNPSFAMRDLILYLAWDRMCVCISRLFDSQSSDKKFIRGLGIMKKCLVDSYLHLTKNGETSPSLYRLLESLVFYSMREESLETHTPAEWAVLSQSFQVLKGEEGIADVFYIDDSGVVEGQLQTALECYLTLDPSDKINTRIALASFMLDKLKSEFPEWNYCFQQKEVVSLSKI